MIKKRSMGVTLLALIIIIFGFFGLLKVIFAFTQRARVFNIFVLGTIDIAEIVCGFGLLNLKEIARKSTIYLYGFSVTWQIVSLLLVSPNEWNRILAIFPSDFAVHAQTLKTLIICFALLFPTVWFVVVTFFLTRPQVKAQFVSIK
jgi:hypothetical protein